MPDNLVKQALDEEVLDAGTQLVAFGCRLTEIFDDAGAFARRWGPSQGNDGFKALYAGTTLAAVSGEVLVQRQTNIRNHKLVLKSAFRVNYIRELRLDQALSFAVVPRTELPQGPCLIDIDAAGFVTPQQYARDIRPHLRRDKQVGLAWAAKCHNGARSYVVFDDLLPHASAVEVVRETPVFSEVGWHDLCAALRPYNVRPSRRSFRPSSVA